MSTRLRSITLALPLAFAALAAAPPADAFCGFYVAGADKPVLKRVYHQWTQFPVISHQAPQTPVFDVRAQFGIQFAVKSMVSLGLSPLSFDFLATRSLGGTMIAYEPRVWSGVVF